MLLTPWRSASPGEIAGYLRDGVTKPNSTEAEKPYSAEAEQIAANSGFVVTRVNLDAIVLLIIPMTDWWQKIDDKFWTVETPYESYEDMRDSGDPLELALRKSKIRAIQYFRFAIIAGFIKALETADRRTLLALVEIVKKFAGLAQKRGPDDLDGPDDDGKDRAIPPIPTISELIPLIKPFERAYYDTLSASDEALPKPKFVREPHVFAVNLNRPALEMLYASRRTVKADAAERLFDVATNNLTFAVIDNGIDALHSGFRDRSDPGDEAKLAELISRDEAVDDGYGSPEQRQLRLKRSRVVKTYDFCRLRAIISAAQNIAPATPPPAEITAILDDKRYATNIDHLKTRSQFARNLDWSIVEPLIEIRHDAASYRSPSHGHGTHVAGILAADLPEETASDSGGARTNSLVGMCRGMRLYDLRVFDENGQSDEFAILSAIEFVGWLNRNREQPKIHGVNLSLALRHHVDSHACGRTPICEACNNLANSGTVVVAAAGNTGFDGASNRISMGTGYRAISITDPGNAEAVITVGSTHRRDPHAYGVSYFSSRGPTGDGRRKPDLVAPGEKITSTVLSGQTEVMDGTSMAAPHVSGAAALLMARYPELIGRPAQIKEILMRTATDLGRTRDFQGAGLLDVLRALQSV